MRGSETDESLEARINKASYELTFKNHFENLITNTDLQSACAEAESIVGTFINK